MNAYIINRGNYHECTEVDPTGYLDKEKAIAALIEKVETFNKRIREYREEKKLTVKTYNYELKEYSHASNHYSNDIEYIELQEITLI